MSLSFPRTRGGDPDTDDEAAILLKLFPAHAGVILDLASVRDALYAFPRTRGGDPWGRVMDGHPVILFPAHAGVILFR